MIRFTEGNLLEADAEALVNTVNTVGVMGKGIALMFKERFPENFDAYATACKEDRVKIGQMFVTENREFEGPRWIVNFPTKTHWRTKTKLEWIEHGLESLLAVIQEKEIRSVALPPLGCGNGGLDWTDVRPLIEAALKDLQNVDAIVFEPTGRYLNVAKKRGVEKLTPARALVAELVRRYCLLGTGCTMLEVQKLAWFVARGAPEADEPDPLRLDFKAHWYGPYSEKLQFLIDSLDGSYLHCERRVADASPGSEVWFNPEKKDLLAAYLRSEGKRYAPVVDWTANLIHGFESPLGMELLATVDWLLTEESVQPSVTAVKKRLEHWGPGESGARKLRIFDDRLIRVALQQLAGTRRKKSRAPSLA